MKKSDIGPFGVMTLVLTLLVQVVALADTGLWALVTACVAGRLALTWACRSGVPAARPDGLGAMVAGTVRGPAVWLATVAALLAAAVIGLLSAPGTGLWAWSGGPGPDPGTVLFEEKYYARSACSPDDAGSSWCAQSPPPGPRSNGAFVLREEEPQDVRMVAVSGGSGAGQGLSGLVVAPVALLAGLGAALLLLAHARRRLGGITGDVLGALVETATAATLVVCAILG